MPKMARTRCFFVYFDFIKKLDVYKRQTWYYVKRGALDWNYTGVCDYYGTTYYIINGVLKWKYSGKVICNGKTYNVVNGVAKLQMKK